MELWAGFLFGLVGGIHCIGMCGPIAIALPHSGYRFGFAWIGRILLYNFGRAVTYAVMGLLFGLAGSTFALFGYQQEISIAIGAGMILLAVLPTRIGTMLFAKASLDVIPRKMASAFRSLLSKHGYFSLLLIGLLNGFLPCGLVYMALAGAIALADPLTGMFYMLFFGMGTAPSLFAVSFFGTMISLPLRNRLSRLAPFAIAILGLILILRGMELGIPYVSPKTPGVMQQNHSGCH